MKRIVFIVEGYYPKYSATGACANSIVEELSSGCHIIVIDRKSSRELGKAEDNHCQILRYNYFDNRIRLFTDEKLASAKRLKRILLTSIKTAGRGYGFLSYWLRRRSINKQRVDAIFKELQGINGKIDAIIPLCLPFEGITAAIRYKRKVSANVKIIPILFDVFSENPTLHRTENNKKRRYNKHIQSEKEMCEQSDRLLFVEAWKNHLNQYFGEYKEKFCQIEHPLLKRVFSDETVTYDSEKINIVYTGALYKKIRSPMFSLKLLSGLIERDSRIVLHFYINGDCDAMVNSYCEKYPGNIINHGAVPRETAKAAMLASDILLSIGNMDANQIPSKIFEYISTGKPILHFSCIKNDPVINILKVYSNSFCMESTEQINPQQEAGVLEITGNKGKQIEFEEVERIYFNAVPKFTADKILEML